MEATVVLSTCGSYEEAHRLARALVEERLAACVQIVPRITSIYRWEGTVSEDPEVLLLIKTVAARVPALTARIQALHRYETPEVVAIPVSGGSSAYLEWLGTNTVPSTT